MGGWGFDVSIRVVMLVWSGVLSFVSRDTKDRRADVSSHHMTG